MREGAVTQLEELVPLHGVVGTRLRTAEPDSIMHDVLRTKRTHMLTAPMYVDVYK